MTTIVQANKLNLLGLLAAACDELGIRTPTSIVGNNDPQIKQLLALAKREGKEFYQMGMRNGGWQEIRAESVFDTNFRETTGNITNGSAVLTNSPSPSGLRS